MSVMFRMSVETMSGDAATAYTENWVRYSYRFCPGQCKYLGENGIVMKWFPYVCPEPVLVKCSHFYINGSKR